MIAASAQWSARARAGAGGVAPFVLLITIAGYGRIFTSANIGQANAWPLFSHGNIGSLTMSANDLEGGFNTSDFSFTVLDYNRLLTQDFQNGVNLIGATATIQVGFAGLPLSQYVTVMTMIVDHVDLANQNTCYKITLRDNSLLLQQFAFETADDGFPTGNNHPATVAGTPMSILQSAVAQSGLPSANVNATAIANLNANVYFGLTQKFTVTYPPRAKDFCENEILKPLGAYWFWNNLGQITPYSMLPYAQPQPVLTLDQTIISKETPPVPMRANDYTAVVIYKMDGDSNGQNFQTDIVGEYAPAVNLYGIAQSRVIQSRGVRSALGGARIARLTMQNIFRRYGLKPFTMKVRCFLPALLVELSDKVTVTHPLIPNGLWPAVFRMPGPMGITGTLWEVISKTCNFDDGMVELGLIDVSWLTQFPPYEIAPNGEGTYVPNKTSPYAFYTNPAGNYSNGDAGRLLY